MLVYGDRSRRADPRACLGEIGTAAARIAATPPGIDRHAALVGLFIDVAGLTQGVADALFAPDGLDRRSPEQDACMALLMALADAVRRSWDSGFAALDLPALTPPAALPPDVEIRQPEGHAFYALYPESYVAAARLLHLPPPIRVIGIRSIGTGLAAIAAATLGAPPPVTLRPVGHPFARKLAVAPGLAAELLSGSASYVVVDEGPGLSGSSFGAVADFLEDHGVPRSRIAFLPSHGGDPGPQASARHRARWAEAVRPVVDFDALFLDRLATWASELIGTLTEPLHDISGGRWRPLLWPDPADWPAIAPSWERRKFLARSDGGTWLLRFAGLGSIGERKLARARLLHAAGFTAEPRGLIHGFLVERWHDDARPLTAAPGPAQLARYLGFRARMFPADDNEGATLPELFDMARFNAGQVLGEAVAARLDPWRPRLPDLAGRVRRVATDGRLAPHEWLRLPNGQLLKADAHDHHAAHDLIGCQDIAWDIAGGAVEFDLPPTAIIGEIARAGAPADAELTAFLMPCYLAFRLGGHVMAANSLDGWPEEAARNRVAADRLAARLDALLSSQRP